MTTFDRVKKRLVDRMHVDEEKVTAAASFRDDLDLDSLDEVEVVMHLEEEFRIEISDDEAMSILTVGDAVKFIDRRVQA